jgi:hypothetical protein
VGDRLHVEDVIGKVEELREAQLLKPPDRDLAFPGEFHLQLSQPEIPGQIDDFADEDAGNVPAAVVGMGEERDDPDMPFPASASLMESGAADDLLSVQDKQREVLFEINFPSPVMEHFAVQDGLLDEKSFFFRHGEKEFLQTGFIAPGQCPNDAFGSIAKQRLGWKFLESKFR